MSGVEILACQFFIDAQTGYSCYICMSGGNVYTYITHTYIELIEG